MLNILTRLSRWRHPYEPLIKITLSKSRLVNNLRAFIAIAPHNRLAPVLKSNAYGHGLSEIGHIIEEAVKNDRAIKKAIPFCIVDSYFEALALRSQGFKTPLLVIGYTRPQTIAGSNIRN